MPWWLPALAVTGAIAYSIRAVIMLEGNRVRAGVWCMALMWAELLLVDRLTERLHGWSGL